MLIVFHGVALLEICTNTFVKEQLLEHTNVSVSIPSESHLLGLDSPQGNSG